MNRNELIYAVAHKAQMTRLAAACAVGATLDVITAVLAGGGQVKIIGFGNFGVVARPARVGRDPRTGAPMQFKACKHPRFSPGKGLKATLNK